MNDMLRFYVLISDMSEVQASFMCLRTVGGLHTVHSRASWDIKFVGGRRLFQCCFNTVGATVCNFRCIKLGREVMQKSKRSLAKTSIADFVNFSLRLSNSGFRSLIGSGQGFRVWLSGISVFKVVPYSSWKLKTIPYYSVYPQNFWCSYISIYDSASTVEMLQMIQIIHTWNMYWIHVL